MKLTVKKENMLTALQKVNGVVGTRTTLPILSNALIQAEKGKLWFTGTDLEVTVRCGIEADVSKTGSTTLHARRLFSIIRELPAEDIVIEVSEKDVAAITCGPAFFKVVGLAGEEFPPLPKFDASYTYSIDQGVFKEMLQKTSYAASTDETRYILNGSLLSFKGDKLTVVATDGRRLALVETEVEFPKEAEIDLIVPTKAVNELLHSLGESGPLKIQTTKNQVAFEFGDVLLISKLIEGTYPNFRQVIPSQTEERVAVERESLLTSLRRVALLTSDRSSSVKLTFGNNQLEISAVTPDVGEARESVPIKYTGKEITIAFNPEFMMDPLRNLTSDEIAIELTDGLSPGLIKCDIPFIYVIMPMRPT